MQHKEFVELADRNRIRIHRVPAPRGLVFDRDHRAAGRYSAVVRRGHRARGLRQSFAHDRKARALSGADNITNKISDAEDDGRPPYEPVTVEEHLEWQQVVALETHQLELPGVSLEITPRGITCTAQLAAHLLGYVGEVTETDLQSHADYHMGDEIGKFGLERVWESFLRGEAGGQEIEVDSVGRRLRVLRKFPTRPAQSVVLTHRSRSSSRRPNRRWAGRYGAMVALDPRQRLRPRDGFASGLRPRHLRRRRQASATGAS